MWQQEKKDSAIVRLALLLAIGTTPMAATLLVPTPIQAQSATDAPAFPMPKTLENGTTVRIDGSSSLSVINQNLKQSFEQQYSGSKVEVAANGTDAALKAVLEGKIDVAALGRGLTPQEQAKGLAQVRLYREKIAIIVGAENPFKGSLTGREFARIFRGRSITDWSQVGGPKGKIRVIDRPPSSDTRENLRSYPVFKAANFTTGTNAIQVPEDNTAEIAKQLGKDGISYALANQVSQLPGVRTLKVHQTSPTEPKYPFSQPLVYVYKKNPNAATAAFLGFAIAPPGKQAIEQARTAEAAAIANGGIQALVATTATTSPAVAAVTTNTTSPTIAAATTAETTTPTTEATTAPTTEGITNTADPSATTAPDATSGTAADNNASVQREAPFWLLLPLLAIAALGGLSWWLLKRRSSAEDAADQDLGSAPTAPPLPVDPNQSAPAATNPPLAAGTGAALSSEEMRNNGEFAWDTEAPAAVVNTSYPNLADASKVTPQPESPPEPVLSDTSDAPSANATEPPQPESNIGENISAAGATALAGGAALAAGAVGWSVVDSRESAPEDANTTIQGSDYTLWDTPASDEVLAEIEQPSPETTEAIPDSPPVPEPTADVVSTIEIAPANTDTPDVGEPTSDVALPIIEATAALPNLPAVSESTSEVLLPDVETATTIPELPDVGEPTADISLPDLEEPTSDASLPIIETAAALPHLPAVDEPTSETAATLPDLPDVPDVDLNAIADEAEATAEPTEEIEEIFANLPEETTETAASLPADNSLPNLGAVAAGAVAAGAGIGAWSQVYGSEESPTSNIPTATNDRDAAVAADNVENQVTLRSHTPKWAYAAWQISDANKQILTDSGSPLLLRLYDVTGIDLSYQTPHLVQQYECDLASYDRFVAIPASDRNYIAEIGYLAANNWVLIDRSETVRVFSSPYTTEEAADSQVADKVSLSPQSLHSANVSWQISDTTQQKLQESGSQLTLRLYDVTGLDLSYQTPQLLQQYECPAGTHETVVAIPASDRNYIAEIGYLAANNWVLIDRSEIVRVFGSYSIVEDETESKVPDRVTLTPLNSESAHVLWDITQVTQEIVQNYGYQLKIRLYDVTGIDLSYQNPQLLQELECPDGTNETAIAIPRSDRNYIAEIGYVAANNWVLIDRSETVRVFSPYIPDTATPEPTPVQESTPVAPILTPESTPVQESTPVAPTPTPEPAANHESSITFTSRTPKWAYVAWHISEHDNQKLHNAGISQLIVRLYDVTDIDLSYQTPHLVQQYECEELVTDRFVAIPNSDRDYMTEIGYIAEGDRWESLTRSANVRVFSRPQPNFWFVADAELIIHGATEPGATVNIGGHNIKLKPDGTFHLRIPFSDGLIEYLMTANSANGEQTQSIHKKFSQDTPEA
ncbi:MULTISPECIES: DUF4912 domain-containing protein [unclassified Tolypothrix]|uniref:DUF4912 domain-containing protein n=1 Tax=unclassified Tolypothrix TaxID=2649714 RepID=UPI0005EAA608|nr:MULTISPECIES: DUF4912 domain-containing protein [unclassified Tolypothrix]BAY90631.1 hypothetical protein NIES3275_26480 [Microchaete diplosiphon NIES-3275]EKF01201.1 hypothetical protein FDUTEX481_08081 [Tolypothrix sp. PCC 7601]MBE9087113.1 DUF4912 domain-containing protein [Tolypothrix sp. LEGE 11397]UYD24784.1 DUF4912 domain-containing protein [Tolypothrix sp. PCC 7712]UYD32984.1 DUF4912 domain-containing protein [Tolypothrix sp. PCC 7601]